MPLEPALWVGGAFVGHGFLRTGLPDLVNPQGEPIRSGPRVLPRGALRPADGNAGGTVPRPVHRGHHQRHCGVLLVARVRESLGDPWRRAGGGSGTRRLAVLAAPAGSGKTGGRAGSGPGGDPGEQARPLNRGRRVAAGSYAVGNSSRSSRCSHSQKCRWVVGDDPVEASLRVTEGTNRPAPPCGSRSRSAVGSPPAS